MQRYWENHNDGMIPEIRSAFANTMRFIWMNTTSSHPNLNNIINIYKNENKNIPLIWQNIIYYIETILNLKKEFIIKKHTLKHFDKLAYELTINNELLSFFENEIVRFSSSNLQFAKLLSGIYYSFINKRQCATAEFKKALEFNDNFIKTLKIDLGSYTYSDISDIKTYNPTIKFVEQENKQDYSNDTTIIVSMDINFLRYYAAQLFYNIIALKTYKFHFHIIAENKEVNEEIIEAKNLFKNMLSFRKSNFEIIEPSFSFEYTPEFVMENKTYYACARFVNANSFLNKFDTNLLIMDADLFINDDLKPYIDELKKHDLSVPLSRGIMNIYPWRRVMAGNIFVKNNPTSNKFLELTKDYIVNHLNIQNSWTLDQNALTYAYEKIFENYPSVNIGNSALLNRPMNQPKIRILVER